MGNSVTATVELICTSLRDGKPCGLRRHYVTTDTGVNPLAKAIGDGWMFRNGAARCRRCGNEANSFGKATTDPQS